MDENLEKLENAVDRLINEASLQRNGLPLFAPDHRDRIIKIVRDWEAASRRDADKRKSGQR